MLDLKSISKTFNAGTVNEKTALNNLCLHLNDGDFVTVIGGNGAGKSTMLNAVAGAWPVDEGTIEIGGVNVTKLPEYKRAKYLGRVFQDPMTGTAASMQIEENMALAARRAEPYLEKRNQQQRTGILQGALGRAGTGAGGSYDLQSWSAFRWSETGTDTSDGYPEKTAASAFG